jgi:hypothetical protein
MECVAGAISGISQNIVGFPMDTMKVLRQNNMTLTNKSISRLYHGISYSMPSQIITNAYNFSLLHYMNKKLDNYYVSGFFTGVSVSPLIFFFDVGKIKNQVSPRRLRVTMEDILSTKGFLTTTIRESVALSIYFGTYFHLRKQYKVDAFLAGSVSGTLNWLITYPLDVIRTRQMTFYLNFRDAYNIGNLTKGLPICLLRAFLVNGIGFKTYEIILDGF